MRRDGPEDQAVRRRPRAAQSNQPLRASWDPLGDDVGRQRSDRAVRTGTRRSTALGRFVATYGWRAYAVPVLVVLTVALVVATVRDVRIDGGDTASATETRDPSAAQQHKIIGAPTGLVDPESLPQGMLPAGAAYTQRGDGKYRIVQGAGTRVGTGEQVFTYTIEVEGGIPTTEYGGDAAFAKMVEATLSNPRSWTGRGEVSFQRVDKGEPNFRISLTSAMTTRATCGYEVQLESSCYTSVENRVVINEARWLRGAVPYRGDDLGYRTYLINHEVGHAIGYIHHQTCAANGELAPIMMQQTFSVSNREAMKFDTDLKGNPDFTCRPNPWPNP